MSGVLPLPPVQQLGPAVLIQGGTLQFLASWLPQELASLSRREGITLPAHLQDLVAAVDAANREQAMSVRTSSDVRVKGSSAEWVSVEHAAECLGISPRQARRIALSLGGRRGRSGWDIPADRLADERDRRNENKETR